MHTTPASQREEGDQSHNTRDKPKKHVDQIDPYSVLHPLNLAIALGILVNINPSESTEDSSP